MSAFVQQGVDLVKEASRRAVGMFDALERRERWFVGLGLGFLFVMMTLLAVFHGAVISWMAAFSARFRENPFRAVILIALYIVVSFPPMIGYSALSLFTGMVFGFPNGWPVIATGTLVGSFLSFITFRYLMHDVAQRMLDRQVGFKAFAEALQADSFLLLWMIRLCPLPYSLSNAGMSAVPSVQPWKFFVATLCCTPKLLLHIFIGSRLANLSTTKDSATWWANLLSIVIAVTVGIVTSWLIYKRTKERADELKSKGAYARHGDARADEPEPDDFEISDDDPENPFSAASEAGEPSASRNAWV